MVTKEIYLELLQDIKSDVAEMKENQKELYTIVKGNGKPGLRQTQDQVAELIRQCKEHREQAAQERARRESWMMFILRPIWPIAIGLLFFGLLQAAKSGRLPM